MSDNEFTFYYGAAAWSERKTLQQLEIPNVMISYATGKNTPWDGIDRLFIDSGGYSLMLSTGEHPPVSQYLDHIADHNPAFWAYQDYPCEHDILQKYDRSVDNHIDRTIDRAITCANRADDLGIDGGTFVLQGWYADDYLKCLDKAREHGLLTSRIGIGSVCGRTDKRQASRIIRSVRNNLPSKYDLHGFGIKRSLLSRAPVRRALTSADSLAYSMQARYRSEIDHSWHDVAYEFLQWKAALEDTIQVDDVSDDQLQLQAFD